MSTPLVSIIIPVYNTEKYINDCLNSVVKQSYGNLEIIVINDGSTDGSVTECEKFITDSRVRFINRENKGLSYTRQQGINLANGEYFCTLDSDDKYDLSFVEQMVGEIIKNDADICVCERLDFDDSFEKRIPLSNKDKLYKLDKNVVAKNIDALVCELWLADSWNKIYRTSFVRKTGVEFWLDNRYNGTDLSFNHLLVLHCPKVCVLNKPLLLHRIVQGSRVHRKNKPLQEGFEIIIDKVFSEAVELEYSSTFYEVYAGVYYRFLHVTVCAIITEFDSLKVLKDRLKIYIKRKSAFEKKYPSLSAGRIKRKKLNLSENTIFSDNLFLLMLVCFLKKIKWKYCRKES